MLHIPVLLKEVIEFLEPEPGQNFVDCTIGEGGHSLAIFERIAPVPIYRGQGGKILGIDLSPELLEIVKDKIRTSEFKKLEDNFILVNDNFRNLKKIVEKYNFKKVSGVLLDLGFSSWHIEKSGRGFSFSRDEPLLMTYNADAILAQEIINHWSWVQLVKIFRDYGEEKYSRRIAKEIVKQREIKKITTSKQLADLIVKIYPKKYLLKIHPATKVFQALRIAVNKELENLEKVLPQIFEVLMPGGRAVIISYHSLEDRIVKNFFRRESKNCICSPNLPICQCGHKKILKIITKKPITPREEEIKTNPRARSAKLRVAEKMKLLNDSTVSP